MKGVMTLAAALATMLCAAVLTADPVEARDGGERGALAYPAGGKPSPPPPDYAFRDGVVIVGGDMVTDCRSFVGSFDEGYDEWGDQVQARRALERCKQAGSPGFTDVSPEVRAEMGADRLTETGGVPLLPLAVAPLLLAGAGLLALSRIG